MTTANIVSRASVGLASPVDITNATMQTSNPVIVSVSSNVPKGSPSRWASSSACRTMAMAAVRMTAQITTSSTTNSTGCSKAVVIQPFPSNASVSVTMARASGHSRHHGSRD